MSTLSSATSPETFGALIANFTSQIRGRSVDQRLEDDLNRLFPAEGPDAHAILEACQAAMEDLKELRTMGMDALGLEQL